jgi:hypothetical protein
LTLVGDVEHTRITGETEQLVRRIVGETKQLVRRIVEDEDELAWRIDEEEHEEEDLAVVVDVRKDERAKQRGAQQD